MYILQASDTGHLELVFVGLDVLSSTGWQINCQVFDIVLESGERSGKIPPVVPDEPEPEHSDG